MMDEKIRIEEKIGLIENAIHTYLPKLVLAALTFVIGWMLIRWVMKLFRMALNRSKIDSSLLNYIGSLVSIILKILLILSVASTFGVTTTSFVAILGAATLAVGMALQGSLNHFAAGVIIMLFRPYKIGDFIEVVGKSGTVKQIDIFTTQMTTQNNDLIYMPNGEILSGPIINYSRLGVRQLVMDFRICYRDDIEIARGIITDLFQSNDKVLPDKPIKVVVSGLNDSFVKLTASAWAISEDFWAVHAYMLENVKNRFQAANIGYNDPKMSVTIDPGTNVS